MDWTLIHQVSMAVLTLTNIAVSLGVHYGYKSLYLEKAQELEETVIKYEEMLSGKS